MTRRPDYQDLFAGLVAFAAFLLVWLLITWLTPEPTDPSPSGSVVPDDSRARLAAGSSRGAERSVPPADLRVTAPPDDNRDHPARASGSEQLVVPSAGKQKVSSGGLPPVLRCIRALESGGDYHAFNGVEHYGAFQLSASYSDDWARRYGFPQWANLTADRWPRAVQDAVATRLFAAWPGAWSTYGACT